ncbi:MAG: GntR family transcriptional regulator [Xanthomonadales bacterium]|nr:GntR family transcriptional regulator [Xanthomonadales bacterium]
MVNPWNDTTPIYVQLRERVVAQILAGDIRPGEALPSVRQVAAELAINPITVSKAYQTLSDDGLVEKRRGLGLYVSEGADTVLRRRERELFMSQEWPAMIIRMRSLGIDPAQLLAQLQRNEESGP